MEPMNLNDISSSPNKDIELLKRDIELLKHTAAHHNLVSLAANQVSLQHRIFTILKQPLIVAGKWSGYQHSADDYEVIANP
jgi:peptide deformylase